MKTISVDVETSKVPRHHPWIPGSYLVSVGMAFPDGSTRTWVFNHRDAPPSNNQLCMIREIQQEVDAADRIVGHNLKFDIQWLNSIGINTDGNKLYCTMLAEYLINGQRQVSYSLAATSQRYGITPKIDRVKMYWESGYETDEIPMHTLLPYLEQDCINTLALYQHQVPVICKWRMERLVSLQMELMRMLGEMEATGIRLDVKKSQELLAQLKEEAKTCEVELVMEFDRDDLNIQSNQELSAALYGGKIKREIDEAYVTDRNAVIREAYTFHYKDNKKPPVVKWRNRPVKEIYSKVRKVVEEITLPRIFAPPVKEELDYYSVDKNTLSTLAATTKRQKKIIELLQKYSAATKAAETFEGKSEGSGLLAKVMPGNLIHTSFNQTIARTGRLTSSNPNGQNLPRKGTSPIKTVFVPRFDLIGNGDLSQIEWRAAVWQSQDPVAMREILDGVDQHRENAIVFFGANPELPNDHPEFKPIRTTAKTFTFRLLKQLSHHTAMCVANHVNSGELPMGQS